MAEPRPDTYTGPQPTGHYGPGYGETDAPKSSAVETPRQAEPPRAGGDDADAAPRPEAPRSDEDDADAALTPPSPS
jgi:hypothetical protein